MKIKYGLKNVHYATITEDETGAITYGTPVKIPGAVNIALSPVGDTTPFYADDIEYFTAIANNGYDGTLELALVPDGFSKDVLGETEDTNNVLFEDSEVLPKPFALLFEFKGDVNAKRHVMYYCKATRPNIESGTKGQSIEPKTETLNLTCRPAPDTGLVKAKTTAQTNQTAYDGWYTAVYSKSTVNNTVAASTATFSKAAPADLSIDVTSSDAINTVTNVKLDGTLIPGVSLTVTGVDVTIAQAYLGNLNIDTYTITVEFEKGNAVTVNLTVTA